MVGAEAGRWHAYRRQTHQPARPGQALVEAAIAFPLLVTAALALVQFALFVHAQHVVTGAVQDGVRVAAASDSSLGRGLAHARELIDAGLGDAGVVTVTGQADADVVILEARGSLRLMFPWAADGSLPLRARAVSQKEVFRAGP